MVRAASPADKSPDTGGSSFVTGTACARAAVLRWSSSSRLRHGRNTHFAISIHVTSAPVDIAGDVGNVDKATRPSFGFGGGFIIRLTGRGEPAAQRLQSQFAPRLTQRAVASLVKIIPCRGRARAHKTERRRLGLLVTSTDRSSLSVFSNCLKTLLMSFLCFMDTAAMCACRPCKLSPRLSQARHISRFLAGCLRASRRIGELLPIFPTSPRLFPV